MKIKFNSPNQKYLFVFFVIYFLTWVVAFKVFDLHLSKLGDYLKYGRGIIIYVLDACFIRVLYNSVIL